MATLSPQQTSPAGSPVSYASADVLGDQTFYNREVILHVRNTNAGTNEVQLMTRTGSPSGGTYTITFTDPYTGVSQTTTALAWNADAATVQAALEALTLIGANNVTVSGSPNFTVTFVNGRSGQSLPLMTVASSMTPSGNFTVTQTTDGAGQIVVTVDSPTPCDQGFYHDQVVAVPGGGDRHIGPFTTRFNQPDQYIKWTYSSVTNVKVAALLVQG